MGLSATKTKTTNAPSSFAQPYVTAGADALGSAFSTVQPQAAAIGSAISSHLPGLEEQAFGANSTLDPATGYNSDVLSGKYLTGNPSLDAMIAQTDKSVSDRVGSSFTAAGRTGSGANAYALSRGLAENENNLRFTDYNSERARMDAAAGRAPALDAASYNGLGAYLQAAQAATGIPLDAAKSYASGIGSLVGGYNTQTGTSTPSLGAIIAKMSADAAKAIASGGGG